MNSVDIVVPNLPESVKDATVASWYKKVGNYVQRSEVLVEIETDKVMIEITSPESGILMELLEDEGAIVVACQVLGRLQKKENNLTSTIQLSTHEFKRYEKKTDDSEIHSKQIASSSEKISNYQTINEHALNFNSLKQNEKAKRFSYNGAQSDVFNESKKASTPIRRRENRVPMTRLRKRMAERLLEAKNNTAMLTSFNEVNMERVIDLRRKYRKIFEKRHGVRLGLMPFYVKAAAVALKRFPKVNAFIDGENIVYRNYFDISIAVSTLRGLVTPVMKDVNTLGIADIEKKIQTLAVRSRSGKLTMDELTGGNFTITNGGVFGSLMSTPIINTPQSAILGIHAIKDRPMAVDGKVLILPIMYLALSYDHRIIDGKESVKFLISIKEILEDPVRLLLDV